MFSVFVKQKATITENITFAISLSRIWSADWSKLVKNEKMTMKSQFYDMTLTSTFFDVFLFRFSSLVTGLSFISRLTRNPEIRNTLALFLLNIWRLGRVMDKEFGTNVSNRMLLNAAKFQDYSFYPF